MKYLLLFSVFVIATCGLVYELVAGTLASYLLGDSVTQFSTVIGVYLFSMGIGAWLSKFIHRNLPGIFIRVETLIALIGGFSAAFLFIVFDQISAFRIVLYSQVSITGILVGLEIPLLMRILKDELEFKDLVSNIFTFDYIGALFASILFPLLFIPNLGLIRTALFFGILNAAVAVWTIWLFRRELRSIGSHLLTALLALAALCAGFIFSDEIQKFSESHSYPGDVIHSETSRYQRVVVTKDRTDIRLYLNGNLQFSSRDEYRYHEALVHPGMLNVPGAKNVLILGGGDGFAVREVLRYPSVEHITLVDLDPAVTRLFRRNPRLSALNSDALNSPKLNLIHEDAFTWIRSQNKAYDFVIIDFPDPSNFSLGKLYTLTFFHELYRIMPEHGALVIQSTSPYYAPQTFWCVEHTLRETGFQTQPYHAYVPSFGEWGFIYASKQPFVKPRKWPQALKFVNTGTMDQMLDFPPDMADRMAEVNRLDNQMLVNYFQKEWALYEQ